jgi:hypothetical protein
MENLFLVQVSTGKSGINGDFQGFKYVITIIKQSFLQFPTSMDPITIYNATFLHARIMWEPPELVLPMIFTVP